MKDQGLGKGAGGDVSARIILTFSQWLNEVSSKETKEECEIIPELPDLSTPVRDDSIWPYVTSRGSSLRKEAKPSPVEKKRGEM